MKSFALIGFLFGLLLFSCASTGPLMTASDVAPEDILKQGFIEDFMGSSFNRDRWRLFDYGLGTSYEVDNGLILSSDSERKVIIGIISTFYIVADFNIELSYKIEQYSKKEDRAGGFSILLVTSPYEKFKNGVFLAWIGNYVWRTYITFPIINGEGDKKYIMTESTRDLEGKLRIKRSNGFITTYYLNRDEWVILKKYPMKFSQPLKIFLNIGAGKNVNLKPGPFKVRFTNLKVDVTI